MLARLASVCACLAFVVVSAGATATAASAPDLQVTGSASSASPAVGTVALLSLSVNDANAQPAQNVTLTLTLPSGLQFVSGTSNQGSGCAASGTTQVVCSLGVLSASAPQANVQVFANVVKAGQLTVTATATSQQGVLTATNSTLSLTLGSPAVERFPAGLNGDGAAKAAVKDLKAPTTRAFASAGKRGTTAKLHFWIYDDSGVARAFTTVKRDGKTIGQLSTGYGPVVDRATYFVGWHIPRRAIKGTYTFCVVAVDRALHASPSSCAALEVK